jgi:hypothetical protein
MRPSVIHNAFLLAGLAVVIAFPSITVWLAHHFGMR